MSEIGVTISKVAELCAAESAIHKASTYRSTLLKAAEDGLLNTTKAKPSQVPNYLSVVGPGRTIAPQLVVPLTINENSTATPLAFCEFLRGKGVEPPSKLIEELPHEMRARFVRGSTAKESSENASRKKDEVVGALVQLIVEANPRLGLSGKPNISQIASGLLDQEVARGADDDVPRGWGETTLSNILRVGLEAYSRRGC